MGKLAKMLPFYLYGYLELPPPLPPKPWPFRLPVYHFDLSNQMADLGAFVDVFLFIKQNICTSEPLSLSLSQTLSLS